MASGCRRSARIASSAKRSTESPAPKLAPVAESAEESVKSKANKPSKADKPNAVMSSPITKPTTPSSAAPIKLPISEMHPSKAHRSMADPSSALRNGFTDINYNTTLAQTIIQSTPSKSVVPSSEFSFRSELPNVQKGLSLEAQKIFNDIREEAARLKPAIAAELEAQRLEENVHGRKIAQGKKKAGRFSAAHLAEFKKMDSIEGHPSAFRAAPGRSTPVKATTPLKKGIKRSQSKADLDDTETARCKTVPARPSVRDTSVIEDTSESPSKPSKRMRQRFEDDASTLRPVTRDGTSIPRPKSSGSDSLRTGIPRSQTLGSLKTPTKSSLARTNSLKTPPIGSVESPSNSRLQGTTKFSDKIEKSLLLSPMDRSVNKMFLGSLKRLPGAKSTGSGSGIPTHVQTPGRYDRIKSILKRHASGSKPASSIPQLSASTTKAPVNTKRSPPVAPPTTPRLKQVDFGPGTKRAEKIRQLQVQSPSPVKSSIPKPASHLKLPAPKFTAGTKKVNSKVADTEPGKGEVKYPDLSAYVEGGASVPGTFTFRSDHTISVNSPSEGFGAAAGQATLRQVRESMTTSLRLPGSFPSTSESSPDKENQESILTIPHGMTNKKRHRAGSDDEDEEPILTIPHGMANKKRHRAGPDEDEEDEGAKRGMKKPRKDPSAAVEGHAVVAPRLANQGSPAKRLLSGKPMRAASQTPSPQKKKKTGLSMSRLNMLARPKQRK
ncbi:hypothetical protein F5Y17DRAFT_462026 [Xylariaceae sp. FL0594]|nr:hypothetical protein F5Y17DRAFT_462026 [Xylariaceae sp. FL0594]